MQIIIDIDENLYTRLFDVGANTMRDMRAACSTIRNGTPLPKGHGRLIDADSLQAGYNIDLEGNLVGYRYITKRDIDNAPTILEADKEGQRDEANQS